LTQNKISRCFQVAESVPSTAKLAKTSCTLNDYKILAASPADFDGDGGMDVLIVASNVDYADDPDKIESFVLWGEHSKQTDQGGGTHTLLCREKSIKNGWDHQIMMDSHPLVMDGNGDAIADLYGSTDDGKSRGIWIFGRDRTVAPRFVTLQANVTFKFRRPHSNAFVDLNNDGNADIFVTSEDGLELWENRGAESDAHFKLHRKISPTFDCKAPAGGPCIGQSIFSDFDLDGKLDMIFPACADDCKTSTLYWATLEELWKKKTKDTFLSVPLELMDEQVRSS
jgi:integrin alpha FG-GAP repeat containing protein 1